MPTVKHRRNSVNKHTKYIKVSIQNNDDTKVKVDFKGGAFSPAEFTSLFMAVLETYTEGLLAKNTNVQVFEHFNNVFGIFLNKLVPPEEHYELSKEHKEFKETADATLGRKETLEDKKEAENSKFAAYLLCRDILIKEVGMTEESADVILNKRLNLETPDLGNGKEEEGK